MRFYARVEVSIKKEITDPDSITTFNSLHKLGYEVEQVRRSIVYHMHVNATDEREARNRVEEMAQRLLTNPVKDDYKIEIEKEEV